MKYQDVLLVDDDEEDREIFREAVGKVSSQVRCKMSDNARDALNQLIDGTLVADLIFLDLHMTPVNGEDFLKEIKSIGHLKDIPVIIFSTHSGVHMRQLAGKLGAMDYIAKPNSFSELVAILKSFL